jgi:hypothetical protein
VSVSTNNQTADPADGSTISVIRPASGSSRYRAFKIVIDGKRVGDLRRGEQRMFMVSPGQHQVWAEIDWCRSQRLQLEVSRGETVGLVCRTRPLDALLAVYTFTLGRHRYPILEPAA